MYVLRVDLSSLVIRPPTMTTKLNQKPVTFVTSFSQTSFWRRCALQGYRHHRCRLQHFVRRWVTKKAAEVAESESVEAGVSPAKSSNAAATAASTEDRILGIAMR